MVLLALSACTVSKPTPAVQVLLVCNGSTVACPRGPHYLTVQSAADAASSGDWILIWPGIYHENNAEYHTGVLIAVPHLHVRGLSRSGVVIDGSSGSGRTPCPSSAARQNFAPRNGIEVFRSDDVSIENLTVCNYLSGAYGSAGNQIWWNGGDASGMMEMRGFTGAFLTATSTYRPPDSAGKHDAQYGIYAGNTAGPGTITDSYASNMAAAAFYVGACGRACDTEVSADHGTNSGVGFLGTDAGGRLLLKASIFDNNRTGIELTSLNNDDGPPPQDGRCAGNRAAPCAFIEDNSVDDNNNASAPSAFASIAVGVGISLDGGQFDTVTGNTISRNGSWGVIIGDSVGNLQGFSFSRCQGGYPNFPGSGLCLLPAVGNRVFGNKFSDDGAFGNPGNTDIANATGLHGAARPPNCVYANVAAKGNLTSSPAGIETAGGATGSCVSPGAADRAVLLTDLACGTLAVKCAMPYKRAPQSAGTPLAPFPRLSGMADPCAGIPPNPFCTGTHGQAGGDGDPRYVISLRGYSLYSPAVDFDERRDCSTFAVSGAVER